MASNFINQLLAEKDDPYSVYAEMRQAEPVQWDAGLQSWLVFDFESVQSVLRNSDSFSNETRLRAHRRLNLQTIPPFLRLQQDWFAFRDPPIHAKLRKAATQGFEVNQNALRVRVRECAKQIFIAIGDRECIDIVSDFARPLVANVALPAIGVPLDSLDDFFRWSDAIVRTLDPIPLGESLTCFNSAMNDIQAYSESLLGNAETTGVVRSIQESDVTRSEKTASLVLLMFSAVESTVQGIANSLCALQNLGKQKLPSCLLEEHVDELLRFDSPVQLTGRVCSSLSSLNSKTISPGDYVTLILGSANRDGARFDAPDTVNFERPPGAHVSFGGGIHTCLGRGFARIEIAAAIAEFLSQFPHFTIERTLRLPTLTIRGFIELTARLRP